MPASSSALGLTTYNFPSEASTVGVLDFAQAMSDNMLLIDTFAGSVVQTAYEVVVGDGTSNIATGLACNLEIANNFTINGWSVFADTSGCIAFDVQKSTYDNFPSMTRICSTSGSPRLAWTQKNKSTTLTGWTTTCNKGDVLQILVDTVSTCKMVTLSLSGYIRDS